MGRRGYPPEFRRKVLDLVEAGRPIASVDSSRMSLFIMVIPIQRMSRLVVQ
jgi:hypothetical protein